MNQYYLFVALIFVVNPRLVLSSSLCTDNCHRKSINRYLALSVHVQEPIDTFLMIDIGI